MKKTLVPILLLIGIFSSCKKEAIPDKPKVVSNSTAYYSTPLQLDNTGLKTANIYASAAAGSTTYKIRKGSNLAVGDDVTLSKGTFAYTITNVDNSNAYYDVITVATSLGAANAGATVYESNGIYLTVFDGFTLRIYVSAVPTTICDGESYVASIVDIDGIGNPYSIDQVQNIFSITVTYPYYINEMKESDELNSYYQAWQNWVNDTSGTIAVPLWSDYVFNDWAIPANTQIFSGKFILRQPTLGSSTTLYVAEPQYPQSKCITEM